MCNDVYEMLENLVESWSVIFFMLISDNENITNQHRQPHETIKLLQYPYALKMKDPLLRLLFFMVRHQYACSAVALMHRLKTTFFLHSYNGMILKNAVNGRETDW